MKNPPSRRPRLAFWVHLARVGVVAALLMAIRSPVLEDGLDAGQPPPIEAVMSVLPSAHTMDDAPNANGMWAVRGEKGEVIANVARTLPMAADVVGYRGPTQALIVFDDDLNVSSVALLDSSDTQEHVDAVINDHPFFDQFRGWPWGGPKGSVQIDAVSGATLTSLALADGVLKRIGGDRPSLVFPDPISDQETAEMIDDDAISARLVRTGPLADAVIGYQGPTELLLVLNDTNTVQRVKLRRSYDNEPYVDYVRTERSFWKIFEGKTLTELAAFDPAAAGVEGVSGATMTSMAVADTIVAAAQAADAETQQSAAAESPGILSTVRFSGADVATIVTLLLLSLFSRLRWFHHQTFRRLWLLVVIGVIGLWAGNLISMALLAGWSAEGVAWRLAPGLTAITAVALLAPPLTKGNPYCNHLCPHGALQQLIRPGSKSKRHLRLPRRVNGLMDWIPGITLVLAYGLLVTYPSIDLSAWEPFHAYLFRIAPWAAIALAAATLLFAAVVPMGYCRLGCPTGRLLDHLRRTSTSHRLTLSDGVAVILIIYAYAIQ
ncbi:MAG: FMN-binding protein [Pirellulaceae bacterium]|nr:FMN-binding protein [Pirellulaceae bacterium]